MRTSRRRFSDGNLGPVAGKAKAFSKGRGRGRAGGGASAGELGKILEKKGLTHEEIFLIRQTMVQTQDHMFVTTSEGMAADSERRMSGSVAVPPEEVVGDDSMVVGKGIMIKGDVDDCATLIVEGYFEGNYRGGFLAVPKGGKYVGMANVRRAEIGGRLHGTLSARTLLEVRSTGKIEGMVRYNDLKMEQGGHMVGDVQQGVQASLNET